ncbi:hypothetical protein [Edaphobacter albus]|uniref:hypothetical protein n=1 Tax=Edaphobacter sp. 4G125 TaxID=2763071 RepID=UPI0016460F32|nr:hypothetical protein [Edaphobacter sp. 4G125]QNI37144.1 hypothetical protein H7846_02085 [Edaphobacter sp. 4G125]
MNMRKQQPGSGIPAWILAIVGFLALLLVVTAVVHPVLVPLCFVLLPVFLFGKIENTAQWSLAIVENEVLPNSHPVRSALFQRPPPSLS